MWKNPSEVCFLLLYQFFFVSTKEVSGRATGRTAGARGCGSRSLEAVARVSLLLHKEARELYSTMTVG